MTDTIDPALAIEQYACRHLKPINEVTERGNSPVQQFYNGATVFLTGGSGFLGKQLIEKLFRSCNISKLYLLLRSKKGKSVNERFQEILEDSVFDLVRKKKPEFAAKIVPVIGDVAEIRLGISNNDWNTLTHEVDIIFHVAATTKFDETLSVATLINVRGTKQVLTLASACSKLRSFIHVSTAFSNATDGNFDVEIQEKFYPSVVPPDTLISLVENVEEERLREMENAFIKGYPNTYTFAKSIAEAEVSKWSGQFPIAIVRPGIVISAFKEPSPGWTDPSCMYSASALIMGTGTGIMHVLLANDDAEFNIVPIDYVNNAIIVAGYETGRSGQAEDIKIYTVASPNNRISWRFIVNNMHRVRVTLVTPFAVWYLYALVTSNKIIFWFLSWITNSIPATISDGVCILMRKKPRFKKLANKMYTMSRALSYFTTNSWNFADADTDRLYKSLDENDKTIFDFDTNVIDINEFFYVWYIGLRKYILKDGLQNTEYANRKQFWFKILHVLVCIVYFYTIWKILMLVFYGIKCIFSILR